MTGTLLSLRKQLPDEIVAIIRSVTLVADELEMPSFIVGATARNIILEHVYQVRAGRSTSDVDFGVALETWSDFEKLKAALIHREGFRADSRIEQRLWRGRGATEMKIDLIPYGGLESPPGTISFPPTGFEMNTSGFKEAFDGSVEIRLDAELNVRVVSLAGLTILKFTAYNDRPNERQTDLEDILFIAKNYVEAENEERLYADTELMSDETFDLRTVGARLLGRDMASLLTAESSTLVGTHLSEDGTDPNGHGLSRTAEVMLARSRTFEEESPIVLELLRQLKVGIAEGN